MYKTLEESMEKVKKFCGIYELLLYMYKTVLESKVDYEGVVMLISCISTCTVASI